MDEYHGEDVGTMAADDRKAAPFAQKTEIPFTGNWVALIAAIRSTYDVNTAWWKNIHGSWGGPVLQDVQGVSSLQSGCRRAHSRVLGDDQEGSGKPAEPDSGAVSRKSSPWSGKRKNPSRKAVGSDTHEGGEADPALDLKEFADVSYPHSECRTQAWKRMVHETFL